MKTKIASATLSALLTGALVMAAAAPTPAQAIPVFDASNYAQNLLTAARTLTQINNQIRSLANEAQMLLDNAKNLKSIAFPELAKLQATMTAIGGLMGQASGIKYRLATIDAEFAALFPGGAGSTFAAQVSGARGRVATAMAGLRQAMRVQAQVVESVQADGALLATLARRSDQAEGALQAAQATNQLLALATKQQFQLQQLIAADYRAAAIERARRLQERDDAQTATRRFLGSGHAYP